MRIAASPAVESPSSPGFSPCMLVVVDFKCFMMVRGGEVEGVTDRYAPGYAKTEGERGSSRLLLLKTPNSCPGRLSPHRAR